MRIGTGNERRGNYSHAIETDSISKVGAVKRLINSHFKEVRYFRLGKCRFVVKEEADGTFDVLTIEWAYLD